MDSPDAYTYSDKGTNFTVDLTWDKSKVVIS